MQSVSQVYYTSTQLYHVKICGERMPEGVRVAYIRSPWRVLEGVRGRTALLIFGAAELLGWPCSINLIHVCNPGMPIAAWPLP